MCSLSFSVLLGASFAIELFSSVIGGISYRCISTTERGLVLVRGGDERVLGLILFFVSLMVVWINGRFL